MLDVTKEKKTSFWCYYTHDLIFKVGALYCFLIGALVWIRILGFQPLPLWRIDLMPPAVQIFAVVFGILYPIAACGLWYDSRWGKLLWGVLMLLELWFFYRIEQHFSFTHSVVLWNSFFLGLYCIERICCRLLNASK